MKSVDRPDTVLIVDFGSQVTQLIARRIREAGIYSEIVPFQSAEEGFARIGPKAVILSGGPASTTEIGSPRAPQAIFESGVPVLGICSGQMTMMASGPEGPSIFCAKFVSTPTAVELSRSEARIEASALIAVTVL